MAESSESINNSESEPKIAVPGEVDEELNALLESALDDFEKHAPGKTSENAVVRSESGVPDSNIGTETAARTENFLKEASAHFEENIQAILSQAGGASGNSSTEELAAHFKEFAEAAAKAISEETSEGDFSAAISQTLKNLSENAETLQNPVSEEELMNMFSNFGIGEGLGDTAGFLPFMQEMMQSLLSKEILYPTIKDIVEKYPAWLEENKSKLEPSEYERYSKQKNLLRQVCTELEKESDADPPEVKKKRFEAILDLMQKMQDCGQPPKDLVGDVGPVLQFDDQGNPVLPQVPGMDPSQCALM